MAFLLAFLASVASSGVALAGVGGASWTPARSQTVLVPSDHRTPGASVDAVVRIRWSAASLAGLRAYIARGLAFTLEVNDLAGHLSATGYWLSDLPGAAYDRDDDDGDGRWEEVEVTAAASDRIRSGRTYHVTLQLSHWWRPCEMVGCRWRWDYRGGRLATLGQLSGWFLEIGRAHV